MVIPTASRNDLRFPLCFSAAQAIEKNQWALGDALIQECGPLGREGVRNNAYAAIQAAAVELTEQGLEYSELTLRDLREISYLYTPPRRRGGVSFAVHRDLRSPDLLDSFLAALPDGERLTRDKARRMRRAWNLQQMVVKRERKNQAEIATAEIQTAKEKETTAIQDIKKATSEPEKRQAAEKRKIAETERKEAEAKLIQTKEPPSTRGRRPTPKQATILIEVLECDVMLSKCLQFLNKIKTKTEARRSELDETAINALVSQGLLVHQKALELVNFWRQENTRRHLSVVGEE
jgi:flagellar biosynthesis GTPase FlhF